MRLIGLWCLVALWLPVAALAESGQTAELTLGQDRFAAGERVRVGAPVAGDLLAAAGEIEVDAATSGDLVALGGKVRLRDRAGQDAYVAGGEVTVTGEIAGNARVAGGSVRLERGSSVGGSASIAGGELALAGDIDGYATAAGGRVYLDGRIAGDMRVVGGEIELGPNARIDGRLTYSSPGELKRHADARVRNGVDRLPWPAEWEEPGFAGGYWLWTLALIATTAVLILLLPGLSARVAGDVRGAFGWTLLVGLIALIFTPVAVVLLLITVLGAPLALLLFLTYPALLLLGYLTAAVAAGDLSLARLMPGRAAHRGARIAAAALALIALGLLAGIPLLGPLLIFAALAAGMGALLRQTWMAARPAG